MKYFASCFLLSCLMSYGTFFTSYFLGSFAGWFFEQAPCLHSSPQSLHFFPSKALTDCCSFSDSETMPPVLCPAFDTPNASIPGNRLPNVNSKSTEILHCSHKITKTGSADPSGYDRQLPLSSSHAILDPWSVHSPSNSIDSCYCTSCYGWACPQGKSWAGSLPRTPPSVFYCCSCDFCCLSRKSIWFWPWFFRPPGPS